MSPTQIRHYELVSAAGVFRRSGKSIADIAKLLNVGKERVRSLVAKFERIEREAKTIADIPASTPPNVKPLASIIAELITHRTPQKLDDPYFHKSPEDVLRRLTGLREQFQKRMLQRLKRLRDSEARILKKLHQREASLIKSLRTKGVPIPPMPPIPKLPDGG